MFYEKRYAILIDNPRININIIKMIELILKKELIPIIFLTDNYSNGNCLNCFNKIDIYRNKFPKLREDNFIILEEDYKFGSENYKWKKELKEKISNINIYAFGTNIVGPNDKMFITNINKYYITKNITFISNKIDSILTDLLNIADVYNIKLYKENKFLPYFDILFRNRNLEEMYYDESCGLSFLSKIKSIQSNKAYIHLIDDSYLSLMDKYNLGEILFSNKKKSIKIESKDTTSVLNILNSSNIKFILDSESNTVNREVNEVVIHVGN